MTVGVVCYRAGPASSVTPPKKYCFFSRTVNASARWTLIKLDAIAIRTNWVTPKVTIQCQSPAINCWANKAIQTSSKTVAIIFIYWLLLRALLVYYVTSRLTCATNHKTQQQKKKKKTNKKKFKNFKKKQQKDQLLRLGQYRMERWAHAELFGLHHVKLFIKSPLINHQSLLSSFLRSVA